MSRTNMGILIGLALGLAFVLGNFGDMLIVALFAGIGLVVAKALDGDVDVSRYLGSRSSDK